MTIPQVLKKLFSGEAPIEFSDFAERNRGYALYFSALVARGTPPQEVVDFLDHLKTDPEGWSEFRRSSRYPQEGAARQLYKACIKRLFAEYRLGKNNFIFLEAAKIMLGRSHKGCPLHPKELDHFTSDALRTPEEVKQACQLLQNDEDLFAKFFYQNFDGILESHALFQATRKSIGASLPAVPAEPPQDSFTEQYFKDLIETLWKIREDQLNQLGPGGAAYVLFHQEWGYLITRILAQGRKTYNDVYDDDIHFKEMARAVFAQGDAYAKYLSSAAHDHARVVIERCNNFLRGQLPCLPLVEGISRDEKDHLRVLYAIELHGDEWEGRMKIIQERAFKMYLQNPQSPFSQEVGRIFKDRNLRVPDSLDDWIETWNGHAEHFHRLAALTMKANRSIL